MPPITIFLLARPQLAKAELAKTDAFYINFDFQI